MPGGPLEVGSRLRGFLFIYRDSGPKRQCVLAACRRSVPEPTVGAPGTAGLLRRRHGRRESDTAASDAPTSFCKTAGRSAAGDPVGSRRPFSSIGDRTPDLPSALQQN